MGGAGQVSRLWGNGAGRAVPGGLGSSGWTRWGQGSARGDTSAGPGRGWVGLSRLVGVVGSGAGSRRGGVRSVRTGTSARTGTMRVVGSVGHGLSGWTVGQDRRGSSGAAGLGSHGRVGAGSDKSGLSSAARVGRACRAGIGLRWPGLSEWRAMVWPVGRGAAWKVGVGGSEAARIVGRPGRPVSGAGSRGWVEAGRYVVQSGDRDGLSAGKGAAGYGLSARGGLGRGGMSGWRGSARLVGQGQARFGVACRGGLTGHGGTR